MTLSCAGLFEPRKSARGLLKSAFNANYFMCMLSWFYRQSFCRISLLKCALQPKIAKNLLKTLFWKFKVAQGRSRSFKVIDVDKSKKPVTSACYDKQHVCIYLSRFHIIRANSGKITSFKGYPFLTLSFKGNPFT